MEVERVTLIEMAESCGLDEGDLRELAELGLLSESAECLVRLRRARRLQRDFELEASALGLLLAFLEQIEALEGQVRHLAAQIHAPRC